jgi:hypothetical protein
VRQSCHSGADQEEELIMPRPQDRADREGARPDSRCTAAAPAAATALALADAAAALGRFLEVPHP